MLLLLFPKFLRGLAVLDGELGLQHSLLRGRLPHRFLGAARFCVSLCLCRKRLALLFVSQLFC